jgi:hypothetical protein
MPKRRVKKSSASKPWAPHWLTSFRPSVKWIHFPTAPSIRRAAVGAAWLVFLGGLTAGWILGVPQLHARAAKQKRVDPNEVVVRFANQPAWVRGDLADTLLRTAQTNIGGDPLVRDDLIAVRENLQATGWFDAIDQVRRVDEDAVEISAQFVQPHTIIRDNSGDHLVDRSGKLLPKSYELGAKRTFHFIAINGARFDRPIRPGMQWEGTDVIAALRLLNILDSQRWRDQIAEIDVSGYLNDQPIKLKTTNGCTIVWGGAPGEEPALEVLADGKLARLNFMYQKYGRIDGNQSNELDITGERAVVMR